MVATVTKNNLRADPQFGGAPYGNLSLLPYHFETNSSGVWVDSDHTDAVQVGDTLILGIIPAGFQVWECIFDVSDAFTAATTCSVGFKYIDGVDSTPAEDAAIFVPATQALSSTAIWRKTGIKAPPWFKKDAYLTLLWAGAAADAVGILDVGLIGIWKGSSLT